MQVVRTAFAWTFPAIRRHHHQQRRQVSMSILKRLAETARRCSPAPTAADVSTLQSLTQELTWEELGISRCRLEPPEIGCMSIAEEPTFTMAIFILPPDAILPLHDHDGMTVVSRVLFGTLGVSEFDPVRWTEEGCFAKQHEEVILEEGETRVLTPERGNVHEFRALEWTGVFDVLVPPYATRGVGCRYFEQGDQQGDLVFLKQIDCPDSYRTMSVTYEGTTV